MRRLKHLLVNSSMGISIGMGFVKFLKALFQIVILILSAKYFGISAKRDSWIISTTVVMVLIQFFFGPLNETLRAKYIHVKGEKGDTYAIKSAISLFRFTTFISVLLIVICYFFSHQVLHFFNNNLSKDEEMATVFMIRIVLPSLILNQIINFWTSILNTYDSFYLPDVLGLVSSLVNVLVLIFLTPYIGIYSLVISMYLSLILLILVLGVKLASHNRQFITFGFFNLEMLKPYFLFALPFYLSYLCGQVAVVIEKKLATNLGVGKISTLDYSRKFIDLPISILITISATVLTPIIAKMVVKNDFKQYSVEIIRFITLGMLVVLPLVLMFVICPLDFSIFFFGSNSFSTTDFEIIASLMSFYSIGIIGVILYTVSGQALVSEKRIKFYSTIAFITQVFPILINFLFYTRFGLITFGVSWSISHFVFGLIMFCTLKIELKNALTQLTKIMVIFIIVGVVSFIVYDNLPYKSFAIKAPIILTIIVFLEVILLIVLDANTRKKAIRFMSTINR